MIQHLLDSDIARAPLAGLNRQHVQHLCNEVEKKHGRSRGDFAAMIISILWTFADERLSKQCKIDGRTNPVHRRGRTYRAAPRRAWPVAVQRRFIEGNPLASTPQGRAPAAAHLALAFALLLETGQRRSDVVRMSWSHIEHDADGQWLMAEAQQKTGEAVPIPLHKDLRVALAKHGGRRKSEFILTTVTGRRYDPVRLSKDIRKRLIEIGEPPGRFTLHGLRKASVVRMAERGATVEMLMSAFGWRSSQMALFYAREASKRRLNAAAWSLVESAV